MKMSRAKASGEPSDSLRARMAWMETTGRARLEVLANPVNTWQKMSLLVVSFIATALK